MNQPAARTPDEASGVFYLYGTTMLAVQSFERTLATLVLFGLSGRLSIGRAH